MADDGGSKGPFEKPEGVNAGGYLTSISTAIGVIGIFMTDSQKEAIGRVIKKGGVNTYTHLKGKAKDLADGLNKVLTSKGKNVLPQHLEHELVTDPQSQHFHDTLHQQLQKDNYSDVLEILDNYFEGASERSSKGSGAGESVSGSILRRRKGKDKKTEGSEGSGSSDKSSGVGQSTNMAERLKGATHRVTHPLQWLKDNPPPEDHDLPPDHKVAKYLADLKKHLEGHGGSGNGNGGGA